MDSHKEDIFSLVYICTDKFFFKLSSTAQSQIPSNSDVEPVHLCVLPYRSLLEAVIYSCFIFYIGDQHHPRQGAVTKG